MYNQYFGFKEPPFRITPDPAFYYETAVGRDLVASVTKQVGTGNSFVTITGEPGTGKTTLLRQLICSSPETVECSLLVNSYSSVTELLRSVLKNLIGSDSSSDRQSLLEQLHRYVREKFMKGSTVALLFDEAQGLSDEGLETLRLMFDQQRNRNNATLSIVLAGQLELDSRLNKLNLRHIKECITLQGRLLPLEDRDVCPYVTSRLEHAGYRGNELFEPAAVERLIDQSSGIPRLINIICDNALLAAYRASEHRVTAAMIDAVAHQLRLVERAPRKNKSLMLPINGDASTALPVLRYQIDESAGFAEEVSSVSPDPEQTLEVAVSVESVAAHRAVDSLDTTDEERLTPALAVELDRPALEERIPTREQTVMPEQDPAENVEKVSAMESVGNLADDTERKNQDNLSPFVGQTKTFACGIIDSVKSINWAFRSERRW
jgi:type II secretory pathway predicted ATPase ExeA